MENKKYYFTIFKEKDISFGIKLSFYPVFSIWINIPFREIRFTINLK